MTTMRRTDIVESTVPDKILRDTEQKWNGWGYADSHFELTPDKQVTFTGDRYDLSGAVMPNFRPWFEEYLSVDINYRTPSQPAMSDDCIPASTLQMDFVAWARDQNLCFSNRKQLRLARAHGHTVHDMMHLREGKFERVPDLVVWPRSHDEVVAIVAAANRHNVVIIPIGGGTTVSEALACPANEERCIVSLDMCQMQKILWVDPNNQLVRAEAGIVGIDLERQLSEKGFTTGHEPDSMEFSTLGGWVATRASGMKKNKYGNIEELLVHVTVATPSGVLQKSCQVPRISAGPDIHHFILGSEGTLGVITEVTLKICPLPQCKTFGSILFKNFESGVQCMREVARQKCQPASLRLVDNEQFIMGQALKLAPATFFKSMADKLKKLYVTKWKGFEQENMCAATIVFEGSDDASLHLSIITSSIGSRTAAAPSLRDCEPLWRHGRRRGERAIRLSTNVRHWYGTLQYAYMMATAYVRDLGFDYGCLGESFETSVPWDKCLDLCRNVKLLLKRECERHGLQFPCFSSCRVTQLYDSGACVYFYFGFNYRGVNNALEIYEKVEEAAREEILACGGSISHHHGVGKLRRKWLPQTVGAVGLSAMKAIKTEFDPNNIFANGNLFEVAKL